MQWFLSKISDIGDITQGIMFVDKFPEIFKILERVYLFTGVMHKQSSPITIVSLLFNTFKQFWSIMRR